MKILKLFSLISFYLFLSTVHAGNNPDQALEDELAYLRAEGQVYSASKKMQKVNDVPAAIFVITQADIHRSGATNVPDVLRMVPGLQVAQINASKWAITARGFNDQFSFKLLVLIDGRTVYTPIFSGVYWHREDTPLEDVDRIEIIRGAGAAIWGANAVNGVINIITKKAKQTQGALFTFGGGNQEQAFASARYGGKIGDDIDYRIYAKGFKRNNNLSTTQQNTYDDWESYQAGFKSEWAMSSIDTLAMQGDIFRSRTGDIETFPQPTAPFILTNQDSPAKHHGENLQLNWKHHFSSVSETALQLYYKHNDSLWTMLTPAKIQENTFDIDFQHRFSGISRHDLMWGINYRYFTFNSEPSYKLSFDPAKRNLQLVTGFLQDDITLFRDKLKLTLGTRLEHNDFTGFEIQPNIRLLWTPNRQHSLWAAISRAVRTPSLSDTTNRFRVTVSSAPPMWALVSGNPDFKSESAMDYEIGYRGQLNNDFSLDIATFYNNYDRIRIIKAFSPTDFSKPYLEIPIQYTNNAKGETMGFEITSQWRVTSGLKMQASYSLLKENIVVYNVNPARESPHQQFYFKADLSLPFHCEITPIVRYVDTVVVYKIPHYVAFDLRVAWKPLNNVELAVVGQNLLDNAHREYGDEAFEIPKTEIQRSVFGKVTVSF